MPATASAMPAICTGRGRSLSTIAANTAVKITWLCRTRLERPAGEPACRPMNRKLNFATPSTSPTAMIQRHATLGRPTKKIAGTAAARNRRAENRIGGKLSRPIFRITKLKPQMAATSTASRTWRGVTHTSLRAPTI